MTLWERIKREWDDFCSQFIGKFLIAMLLLGILCAILMFYVLAKFQYL